MTISDIVAKRKARWEERHDLEYDKQIVATAVQLIKNSSELRAEIQDKPYKLIECVFYVVNKEKETVPFFLNEVQQDFIRKFEEYGTDKPFLILKGRQQGFTTLITAMQLSFAIIRKNFSGFTIADCSQNTLSIFNDKARTVYNRLPEFFKPSEKFNSRNELFFDKLNSSWRISTATEDVGRSMTLNFVHFSEAAFYKCSLAKLQAGIGPAIVAGAVQIYETTACGFNEIKDLWDNGSCHNLFYEWWRSSEYRSTEYSYLETTDAWLIERCKLLRELGCDKEQITWYCKKYSGYLDKRLIRQEYPCTAEEAFLVSGYSMFDLEAITNQLARLKDLPPARIGYFEYDRNVEVVKGADGEIEEISQKLENIRWRDDPAGYITLHDEPEVKRSSLGDIIGLAPYALGGDTAGDGEDYFTAKVIHNMTGKTVATLRKQRIDEDIYAEQLYCLGMHYNKALIGVEINYSRLPTKILSEKYSYPNLYMREKLDGISNKVEMSYGFETTSKTKPIIINNLVAVMRDNPTLEVDRETLKEMSVFVKTTHGGEAMDGFHDDLVMALAIAHHVGKQQDTDWLPVEAEENNFFTENFRQETPDDDDNFMSWDDL